METQAGLGQPVFVPPANFMGLYLAQIFDVIPQEHAVRAVLTNGSVAGNTVDAAQGHGRMLKCKVMEHRAGPFIGQLDLPRPGDWGLVAFPNGSEQFAVWMGCLYQDMNNIATTHPEERIDHHDSGVYSLIDQDGDYEFYHPSGTYLRIGSGTELSQRTRQERQGNTRRTVDYAPPDKPVPTVHLAHTSGLTITIEPNGALSIMGPDQVVISIETDGSIIANGQLVLRGDDETLLGPNAIDQIVLKAGLDKIIAAFNAHIHPPGGGGNTGVPTVPIPPTVVGTDCTENARAG